MVCVQNDPHHFQNRISHNFFHGRELSFKQGKTARLMQKHLVASHESSSRIAKPKKRVSATVCRLPTEKDFQEVPELSFRDMKPSFPLSSPHKAALVTAIFLCTFELQIPGICGRYIGTRNPNEPINTISNYTRFS